MTFIVYPSYLANIFSSKVLQDLAKNGEFCRLLSKILEETNFNRYLDPNDTYGKVFEKAFKYLEKNYRNEYVYKNRVTTNILLGRHSLKTSTLIDELRIGKSKADLVILNGTSSVYEIKTELDTLDRLQRQIESYMKVFDKIYIVTYEDQIPKVDTIVPQGIGLLTLKRRGAISTHREAISNMMNIDPNTVFDIFRKEEYMNVLKEVFGGDYSKIPNTKIRSYAKSLFSSLSKEDVHRLMLKHLKRRQTENEEIIKAAPKCLQFGLMTANIDNYAKMQLLKLFSQTYPK